MAIISFGKINKKILYAIFGGIFKLLATLAKDGISKDQEIELKNHPFILGINSGLGLCFSFIPFLISKKNYHDINCCIKGDEKLIYNDVFYEVRKNRIYYLLIIAFCDFTQKLLFFLYVGLINFWIFDIPFIIMFSHFILKRKLYIHHFITLIFIIIFGVVIIVVYYLFTDQPNDFFFQVLNTLILEIVFSLEIVVAKYALEYKFCSPYEICLFEGLFQLILNLILLIIFTYIPLSEINYITSTQYEGKIFIDNFFQYFSKMSLIEVISFIISALGRFGFTIFCLIVTKYFTPSHSVIIIIIGDLFFILYDIDPLWKILTECVLYLILIFVILVFLEIIEINCFGLQKNTEKNIQSRAMKTDSTFDDDFSIIEKEDEEDSVN